MRMGARRQFRPEGLLGGWGGPAERAVCKPMLPNPELLGLGEERGRSQSVQIPAGAGRSAPLTTGSGDLERQWERISLAATCDDARRGSALVWLLSTGGRPGR